MNIPTLPAGFRRFAPLLPAVLLFALAAVCFSKLLADPSGLIVDGRRPSLDYANPGEPRPVGNDLTFLFLPHHLFISRMIGETGHWPMWDPTGFGGRPMLGNPQSGMFYPPVWLVWYSGSPSSLGWLTVAHLIWGGIGTYLLARLYGQSRLAATVAAGSFQAAPYLLGHVFEGHYPHVWGVCWFPWAFWAFDNRRLKRLRGIVTLPFFIALVYVVGHPQEGFLLGLALTFRAFVDWTRSQKREGILIRWCGVMLIASGFAAIDLVPQIALRNWKLAPPISAESGSEVPGHYSLRLINALQLLTPEALGGPSDYDGYDNSWETMLSFGLSTFVLAIAAALLHPERQTARSWLMLGGLTFWVACGYKLGLYALLYHLVPGMNFFRVPARPLFLTALAVSILAGLGVDALKDAGDWRRLGRVLLVPGVLLLIAFLVTAIAGKTQESRQFRTDRQTETQKTLSRSAEADHSNDARDTPIPRGWGREKRAIARVAWDPKVWLLILGIGSLIGLGSLRSRWNHQRCLVSILGFLVFIELGFWGHSLIQVSPAEQFMGRDPVADFLSRTGPTSGQAPIRLKTKDTFYSDLRAISNGFQKVNVNDSFQLRHAAVLYQQLYAVGSHQRRQETEQEMDQAVDDYRRTIRQRIFDILSVGFLISNQEEPDPGWPLSKSGHWDQQSDYFIQANPTVLPRAYVVGRAQTSESDPALILSHFRVTNPREAILMAADPLTGLPASDDDRQPLTPADWLSSDPDHLRLSVTTQKPGLLVVADTWMPGWTATLDGTPVEILRGNLAQRVIPILQAGTHTITLDYHPPGLTLGISIFLGSFGIWGLLCYKIVKRRTNETIPNRAASGATIPSSVTL